MKALVLAAGKGTRVRPLTYEIPKPMIPVFDKPVLEFLIELLRDHGIKEIMINTSYLSNVIEDYFRDGSSLGVQIAYSFEGIKESGVLRDIPVGSAGAIKKIQEHSGFFDQTFVVLCGDAIVDIDLRKLQQFHQERRALATIGLAQVPMDAVSNYGVVVTNSEHRIVEFQEKPPVEAAKSNTINTGIYMFEPEIIDRIPSGRSFDIGGELFPGLVTEKAGLYGVSLPFQWLDIGNVRDYYRVLDLALRKGVHGLKIPGNEIAPGINCGLNVRIDLSRTRIVPPVFIGGSATIEPGCEIIGPAIIGKGCFIESGARIDESFVFEYTRVASQANVRKMMIRGRYCIDSEGTVIDLVQGDVDWIIYDARSPAKLPSEEQKLLLEALGTDTRGA